MTLIFNYSGMILGESLGQSVDIIRINLIFFAVYAVATIVIILFYIRAAEKKQEIEQRKAEYEANKKYTQLVEMNSSKLRKFRHDINNIFLSMECYFLEKDYQGLENYFFTELKPEFRKFLDGAFDLDRFSKITIPAVKSLLIVKLMALSEEKHSISLEIKDEIANVPMELLDLVRVLGILLDNAVEEIEEADGGELIISIFQLSGSTHFIVKNTVRSNTSPIWKLKGEGFTTKKTGSGIGLHNISEIIEKYPNVLMETKLKDSYFVQHLIITKDD